MPDRELGASFADHAPMVESLRVAVPLRIDELAQMDPGQRDRVVDRWAAVGAELVAHHGDMLMFPTKAGKRHTPECRERQQGVQPPQRCDCLVGTAAVFNALAKGLAAGAFLPGGVEFAGCRWEVEAPASPPARRADRPVVTVELPEVVSLDG